MLELLLLIMLLGLFSWSAWIDTLWLAGVALALYLAGNWLFGDLSHLSPLADPLTAVSVVVFSLAVGTVWSLWKWRKWMHKPSIQEKLKRGQLDHATKDSGSEFKDSIYFPRDAKPSNNVDRIVSWIVLWPFSMLIYFFEDLLMDIGRWIYNRLGGVYVRITDSAIPKNEQQK